MPPASDHVEDKPSLLLLGCGYLGLSLAQKARSKGWMVAALTRNPATAAMAVAQGIDCKVARLEDDSWHQYWQPWGQHVVFCAGAGGQEEDRYRTTYLESQASAACWAKQGQLASYTYTSSTSVYPQQDGSWVAEADAVDSNTFTRILLEAEQKALTFPAAWNRVFRLAGIYGPGRHLLLDHFKQSNPVLRGAGETYLNLIHRDDAVTAILSALHQGSPPTSRVLNLADGNPATRQAIVAWIAGKAGLPEPRFSGSASETSRHQGSAPSRRVDVAALRHALGWEPAFPSFREGYEPLGRELGLW